MVKNLNTTAFVFVLISNLILAQWSSDPAVNTCVSSGSRDQTRPVMVEDGSGGVIFAIWDDRNSATTLSDIYVQKINSAGEIQWGTNGIAICTSSGQQTNPSIVSDGTGGAIIVWTDYRDGSTAVNTYAQKINSSGTAQWAANGVQLANNSTHKRRTHATTDGSGGAIFCWDEQATAGAYYDIRVQRINSAGTIQWGANGIEVTSASNNQEFAKIVDDGSNGIIVSWDDKRSGMYQIYAQRFNSSGTKQWTADGVEVTDNAFSKYSSYLFSLGSGESVICWSDSRNGNGDVFAQKLNSSGADQWTSNGVTICNASSTQQFVQGVSDGSSGAIFTWHDYRDGAINNYDIYSQKFNSSGTAQWTANGVAICTATNEQKTNDDGYPAISMDGSGGAVITWQDKRGGSTTDIYAQKINSSGSVQWTENGIEICTATAGQYDPVILTDGAGGAFISWMDYRAPADTYSDVYIQYVSSNALLPVELISFSALTENSSVMLNWETATEVNNYGFEIERKFSVNIDQFSNWETIGFIAGYGNSNSHNTYEFKDNTPPRGELEYRLKQIDTDGRFEYYKLTAKVDNSITSIDENQLPQRFALYQNYPNPFNPATTISFQLSTDRFVELRVFDILGKEVNSLINQNMRAGFHSVIFNSDGLPSGSYIYQFKAGGFIETKKMTIIK